MKGHRSAALSDHVHRDDPLVKGENLGLVAPVIRFDKIEQAVEIAKSNGLGLAAYAVTQSLGRAMLLCENLQAGNVADNEGRVSAAEMPFGGLKDSGLGREGAPEGLSAYLEARY